MHEKSQSLRPREAPNFFPWSRTRQTRVRNGKRNRQLPFYPPTVSQYANLAAASTTQQPLEVWIQQLGDNLQSSSQNSRFWCRTLRSLIFLKFKGSLKKSTKHTLAIVIKIIWMASTRAFYSPTDPVCLQHKHADLSFGYYLSNNGTGNKTKALLFPHWVPNVPHWAKIKCRIDQLSIYPHFPAFFTTMYFKVSNRPHTLLMTSIIMLQCGPQSERIIIKCSSIEALRDLQSIFY